MTKIKPKKELKIGGYQNADEEYLTVIVYTNYLLVIASLRPSISWRKSREVENATYKMLCEIFNKPYQGLFVFNHRDEYRDKWLNTLNFDTSPDLYTLKKTAYFIYEDVTFEMNSNSIIEYVKIKFNEYKQRQYAIVKDNHPKNQEIEIHKDEIVANDFKPISMDEVYPLINIPQCIENIIKGNPPSKYSPPVKPSLRKAKDHTVGVLLFSSIIAILALISDKDPMALIAIPIIALPLLFVNRKLMREDQDKLQKVYDNKLIDYNYDLSKYHNIIKQEYSKTEIENWRIKELKILLSKSRIYSDTTKKVLKGRSELSFFSILNSYFPGKILIDKEVGNFEKPYIPDFIFDNGDGLVIDIEIDEAYSIEEMKPIHYIGKDGKRDMFFLDGGWIVIRFSEEQIIKHPDSCCKTIAYTLCNIKSDISYLKLFCNTPDLSKHKRWTFLEAEQLVKENYRTKLLQ